MKWTDLFFDTVAPFDSEIFLDITSVIGIEIIDRPLAQSMIEE